MLEITHGEEPEILRRFKAAYQGPYTSDSWKQFKDYESAQLNDKVVVKTLHSMQEGLCVYCERKIFSARQEAQEGERDRQVEHLKCRRFHPQETLTYSNLALSCISNGARSRMTCGNKKADNILPILPTEKHRHLFDVDAASGRIIPALGATEQDKAKVKQCVQILNLDLPVLSEERKQIMENVKELQTNVNLQSGEGQLRLLRYLADITGYGKPFAPTFRKTYAALLSRIGTTQDDACR